LLEIFLDNSIKMHGVKNNVKSRTFLFFEINTGIFKLLA
jgi:hypothetical protein